MSKGFDHIIWFASSSWESNIDEKNLEVIVLEERFVFVLDTEVHTLGRKFDSRAPTARRVFEDLEKLYKDKKLTPYKIGNSDVSVSDIAIQDDHVAILFRLADDKIPDNRFLNLKTRALRDASRKTGEAPAVSAHFVIDISAKHDTKRTYPTIIENANYLSKTTILSVINYILKDFMTTSREWTPAKGEKVIKPFTPRLAYQADYRNTIDGMLNRNGAVIGITYTDEKVEEITMAAKATAVRRQRSIKLIPEGKPTGEAARDFIKDVLMRKKAKSAKTAKIIIEDPDHGKPKVVSVDTHRSDALKSAFIPQKKLKDIAPPLKICEDKIHLGFVDEMKKLL
ncbi:hypothetical protein Q4560_03830 [Celeribacter halophilus]|uniref:hypothetical protein n=1 Tax=Celeribacter halophilus TaxID=576117 RepID=UPI0026E2704C|nr:hypothetical protein [Celeribacter halophilus]MDO6722387.1 hypothetical protein [Celeribacter halophilus]